MAQKKIKINVSYEQTTREYELDRTIALDQHLIKICDLLNLIHEKDKWSAYLPTQKIYLKQIDLSSSNFVIDRGMEFKIKLHPRVEAEQIIASFSNTDNEKIKKSLFNLHKNHLQDKLFVEEFLKLNGLNELIMVVSKTTKTTQVNALNAVDNLLNQDNKDMGLKFPDEFLDFVISLCNSTALTTLRSALSVLLKVGKIVGFKTINDSLIRSNSTQPYNVLIDKLKLDEQESIVVCLSLIIGLMIDDPKETLNLLEKFESIGMFQNIQNLLKSTANKKINDHIYSYQMIKYQHQIELKNQNFNKEEEEHVKDLKDLWDILKPEDYTPENIIVDEGWKKLGFQSSDPTRDFRGMGRLGVKHLLYFAQNHKEDLQNIINEQHKNLSEDKGYFPVAAVGINMSSAFVDLFRLEKKDDKEKKVFDILFEGENSLEELYCIGVGCVALLFKKMNATYMQFGTVFNTIKSYLQNILSRNVKTISEFDTQLRQMVNSTSIEGESSDSLFTNVTISSNNISSNNLNNQSMMSLQSSSNLPIINQKKTVGINVDSYTQFKLNKNSLKETLAHVIKSSLTLINKTKIDSLILGGFAQKVVEKKAKGVGLDDNFTFMILSKDQQKIFFTTCSSCEVIPSYSESDFFSVDKITDIQFGNSCPFLKKFKKVDIDIAYCFSFNYTKVGNQVETHTFYARSRNDLINWVDGFHSLKKSPMVMIETTSEELKILVDAEMLIRSLDLVDIDIPDTIPSVPPPPSDYNFNFMI